MLSELPCTNGQLTFINTEEAATWWAQQQTPNPSLNTIRKLCTLLRKSIKTNQPYEDGTLWYYIYPTPPVCGHHLEAFRVRFLTPYPAYPDQPIGSWEQQVAAIQQEQQDLLAAQERTTREHNTANFDRSLGILQLAQRSYQPTPAAPQTLEGVGQELIDSSNYGVADEDSGTYYNFNSLRDFVCGTSTILTLPLLEEMRDQHTCNGEHIHLSEAAIQQIEEMITAWKLTNEQPKISG